MPLARIKRLAVLLVVLLACSAVLVMQRRAAARKAANLLAQPNLINHELLTQFTALEERERVVDETAWVAERRAEECGAVFDALWDELNMSTNRFQVLAAVPIPGLVIANYGPPQNLVHGIQLWEPGPRRLLWSQPEWQHFLQESAGIGWQLTHVEFKQRAFNPSHGKEPESSRVAFRADVENPNAAARATIEGDLLVEWSTNCPGPRASIGKLDAGSLLIKRRVGNVPFKPILTQSIVPSEKWHFIDPLILYDLDGDGLSEIILAAKNQVYRRRSDGQYRLESLCRHPLDRIFTAVIADFDGDGFADLLCARAEGLFLFKGSPQGSFDAPARLVWAANPPLKYVQVLTCGDIDRDGDLDLFLAQYKTPYFDGQMPSPYYDANDANPAYLLLNDGKGNFVDATESSGLAAKRWRRSYSGSFARLEGDSGLDLVVVSDFAGMDLYRNNGHGHFSDVTKTWLPDSMGFGMGHALADFDADGRLDLLMIGMDSPAVDRLEHLKQWRADAGEDRSVRSRLACGNRLSIACPGGGFKASPLGASVARSGWSWGCSAADFDNDGWPDLYIANGHETRASARDYEAEFWLHDIYVAGPTNNRPADLYFQSKFTRTRGRGASYAGYQPNCFYLNLAAASFFEVGHLYGVALEQDCRDVVADDLDGDGKMDLLVTTFEVWPEPRQTLHVYQNAFADVGNWIGFRFREAGPGRSPVGASVTIHYGTRVSTRQIVTGDSYRCQSANTLHFGLGQATKVDWAEVMWADGANTRIEAPGINTYTRIERASSGTDWKRPR